MDNPDHSSRGHAEFSPSSLKYVACPGFKGRGVLTKPLKRNLHTRHLKSETLLALHNEEELEIYEQICKDEEVHERDSEMKNTGEHNRDAYACSTQWY